MYFTLKNGVKIPSIGFGTYKLTDAKEVFNSLYSAIQSGYRLIDTASFYENETEIGAAIKKMPIPREELFITSKVWKTQRGYQNTLNAFDESLNRLKLSYLDLYLIHWPATPEETPNWKEEILQTWQALSQLYKEKKVRAIGVSNFTRKDLELLIDEDVQPMLNQIKFHPGLHQSELLDYCRKYEIVIEAYSPLARGSIFKNPTIEQLSKKYQKSPAQICLRYSIEKQIIPIPKSKNAQRIAQNIDVYDFHLTPNEIIQLDSL